MPKPYTLILVLFLSYTFSVTAVAASSPEFSVNLSTPQLGASSDIILDFNFPGGTEIPTKIDIGIPAGFELSPSSSFSSYTVVGQGNLSGYFSGNYYSGFITLYNADEPEGIRWNMYLTFPSLPLERGYEISVLGNSQQGYTFSLPDLASLGLTSPSSWHLKLFGKETDGQSLFITSPKLEGIYPWIGRFHQSSGEVLERQIEIGIGNIVAATSEPKSKVPAQKQLEKKATATPIAQTPSPTNIVQTQIQPLSQVATFAAQEERKGGESAQERFSLGRREIVFLSLAGCIFLGSVVFRLVQVRRKK